MKVNPKDRARWRKTFMDKFKKENGVCFQTVYNKRRIKLDKKYRIKRGRQKAKFKTKQNNCSRELAFNHGRFWTQTEKKYILENRGKISQFKMALKLGRTKSSINKMIYKLTR